LFPYIVLLAHLLRPLKSINLGHYTHTHMWNCTQWDLAPFNDLYLCSYRHRSHTNSERDPLSKTEVIWVTRAYTLIAGSLQYGSTVSLRCANDAVMLTALSLLGRFLHSGLFLRQGIHPAVAFIPWL